MEGLTMTEEAENKIEPQRENVREKEGNRLPYEPPRLRKHGKVSNATQTIPPFIPPFDGFGPPFTDLS
jgi:hypothetical protein